MKGSVVFEGQRDQFTPPDCHIQRAFCLEARSPKKSKSKSADQKKPEKKPGRKVSMLLRFGCRSEPKVGPPRPASSCRSRNRLRWIAGLLWAEGSKAGQSVGGQYLCGLCGCRENNHSRLDAIICFLPLLLDDAIPSFSRELKMRRAAGAALWALFKR